MTVFIVFATVVCIALFGFALWPLLKQQRMAGTGIGVLSVVLVGMLYWQLGKPEAIGFIAPEPEQTIESALADLEVEYEDKDSYMYYIRYPFKDQKKGLTVATTRPETMLGDTAVAVNPEDPVTPTCTVLNWNFL